MNIIKFLLVVSIFALIGCDVQKKGLNENDKTEEHLKTIKKETELSVPVDSKLLHFIERDVVVDPAWVAKIFLPKLSVNDFVKELSEKQEDKTIWDGAMSDATVWWKPENIIISRTYSTGSQAIVRVIVSKEDEEYFAYIEHAIF